MNFVNKVALVTGSGSGLGEAIALLLAKEGADVVIVDFNEENANKTAYKCKQFGRRALVVKTDVSKIEEAKNAIDQAIEKFGKLDVLINNAGIVRVATILSGTIMDTYDELMNTNLRSVVMMTSLAAPYLIQTKGCIVNTSSVTSISVQKSSQYPVYAISKAGIDCFTRLSALELAPSGVRVNAVNPGSVNTNLLKNSGSDVKFQDYAEATLLRRISEPEEIAYLIVYLASDKAKSITGSNYIIDNGLNLV